MSDLLSPILVTMMDEAHAYVCFCSLMQRLRKNFMVDGLAMTKMFQHLSEGLMYYDPEFFAYLKINQADDLLFCYRWLLLEMKREFAFEDSLQVLETLWASLPPSYPPKDGLQLFEVKLSKPAEKSEKELSQGSTPRKESVYAKMVSLRRRTTSRDLRRILSGPSASKNQEKRSRIQSEPTNDHPKVEPNSPKSPSSQLKITDLKDFNKLTASSSNNSLKDSSPSDDPFDHDNIGYLNGNSSNDNSASIGKKMFKKVGKSFVKYFRN